MKRRVRVILAVVVLLVLNSCQTARQSTPPQAQGAGATPPRVFSISSGDVTPHTAVIWGRATGTGEMHVSYDSDPSFSRTNATQSALVTDRTDFTAKINLRNLKPGTFYHYRVWVTVRGDSSRPTPSDVSAGQFKTAPDASDDAPVSFLLGGDTGGQGYCRRVGIGYAIYSPMRASGADFFIQNGDGVYADYECPEKGPEPGWQNIPGNFRSYTEAGFDWTDRPAIRETILSHYRYSWADDHLKTFLASLSTYAQMDDHEVIDDFGAQWTFWNPLDTRPGYSVLVEEGLSAFHNYWPIEANAADPKRIYRSFRWGKNVELFLLDTRSYRSRNNLADSVENNKTLLGKPQLEWLKERIAKSTATWKIVSSTCPLAIYRKGPKFAVVGQDCWAHGDEPDFSSKTGFTRELVDLMTFLAQRRIKNMVWLATDVHVAESTRYQFEGMVFHEFVVGPLNAGRAPLGRFDPTLNPTHLFEKSGTFNFGYFRVMRERDGASHFIAEVRDDNGAVLPGSVIDLIESST